MKRATIALTIGLCLVQCHSGTITGPDGGGDSGPFDASDCPAGTEFRDGQCLPTDETCIGVVCGPGTYCERGVCIADEPCDGVVCSNPGEVCQGGTCVSGEGDEDDDGILARDDCDDTDPLVYPGAPERCNGFSDACVETFVDGSDECPGLCCGERPACRECCETSQCGDGPWECVDGDCVCLGVLCGEDCRPVEACCEALDCGVGSWQCTEDECSCPGVACDGECFSTGECCGAAECGSGDWGCEGRECSCDLMVVSARCGLCEGRTYSGHGCGDCPEGSYEVYCPGPGCSRACNSDDSCSNRYKHSASAEWIEYPNAFCYSGSHEDDTYWEMR